MVHLQPMTNNARNLGRFLNRVTRGAAGQVVAAPRHPDPARTFLAPRIPGPLPTPEEVDFAFEVIPQPHIPFGPNQPKALYIADVLKKVRQKYGPGEARRQLRRDYESKLGRRSGNLDRLLHSNMVNGLEYTHSVPHEDPDYSAGLDDLVREQKSLLKKELRALPDKYLHAKRNEYLTRDVPGFDAKAEVEAELLRRKAVRGLQLVTRDDIPRRGLLKMAASQIPAVKQGQRLLEAGERVSPVLIKALKAILSRKFRSV